MAQSGALEKHRGAQMMVGVLATLDSKGDEAGYIADALRRLGHDAVLIDCSLWGEPQIGPDIRCERGNPELALANLPVADLLSRKGNEVAKVLRRLYDEEGARGFVALGGGKGTSIAGIAMRALPLNMPRVIVSSGRPDMFARVLREHRIVIVPSSADLAGLNRLTRSVLRAGAHVLHGLMAAEADTDPSAGRPVVAITSFGATTPAVRRVRAKLEAIGLEVAVYPATGVGGRALETSISEGEIDAVIDLTTAELANHLFGGTSSAGPSRLEAAGVAGIPQIVVPGANDFLNFNEPESVPEKFADRASYRHTPYTTLVRTSAQENFKVGQVIAEKLNRAQGKVCVVVPGLGYSVYDREGGPFWLPEADHAWVDGLKTRLADGITIRHVGHHINQPEFADEIMQQLTPMLMAAGLMRD